MRIGRFGHPSYSDAEVTQMIDAGLLEPDGSPVDVDALDALGLDRADDDDEGAA